MRDVTRLATWLGTGALHAILYGSNEATSYREALFHAGCGDAFLPSVTQGWIRFIARTAAWRRYVSHACRARLDRDSRGRSLFAGDWTSFAIKHIPIISSRSPTHRPRSCCAWSRNGWPAPQTYCRIKTSCQNACPTCTFSQATCSRVISD